jgi:hypothetical protein
VHLEHRGFLSFLSFLPKLEIRLVVVTIRYIHPNFNMAPFFGLTGVKLHAAIWTESLLAVMTFGYCSAGAGGVLNNPWFLKQFPSIDVADAPAREQHNKSTIQGMHS